MQAECEERGLPIAGTVAAPRAPNPHPHPTPDPKPNPSSNPDASPILGTLALTPTLCTRTRTLQSDPLNPSPSPTPDQVAELRASLRLERKRDSMVAELAERGWEGKRAVAALEKNGWVVEAAIKSLQK